METLLPIGIQSFSDLRTTGYKYVDKTARMYQLTHRHKHVFLSRPRRFGKSLLVSTLDAYFSAEKELFNGLAIESLEKDWVKYPVFHLDLNSRKYDSTDALIEELSKHLCRWELIYGDAFRNKAVEERFEQIIRLTHEKTGQKVVILVDEYDKPLITNITNPALQDDYRATLKAFYSVLKTCDEHIRFSLLTGVTKFSKVSIFSDLNNLDDISRKSAYYDICGISEGELKANMHSEVEALARRLKCETQDAYLKLKEHYDGYRFTDYDFIEENGFDRKIDGIYNPFSLLNALKYKSLDSYWFETGTPSFLIERLSLEHYEPKDIDEIVISYSDLSTTASNDLSPIQYLFQTGYLTIKDYDTRFRSYTLGYPNNEVKEGFLNCLLSYFSKPTSIENQFNIASFVLSLESGDIEDFIARLKSFLASIPYELIPNEERHLQNVVYLLSTLCGFYCEVESHTNKGRIDMTIKTPQYIYIFEFKFDRSANEALEQIKEKGYTEKFASDGRDLIYVGMNYSSAERNISEYLTTYLVSQVSNAN